LKLVSYHWLLDEYVQALTHTHTHIYILFSTSRKTHSRTISSVNTITIIAPELSGSATSAANMDRTPLQLSEIRSNLLIYLNNSRRYEAWVRREKKIMLYDARLSWFSFSEHADADVSGMIGPRLWYDVMRHAIDFRKLLHFTMEILG